MSGEPGLDQLVEQAREGDEVALEAVVRALQDRIYNLALRMLWHPSDAEDATQEILLKVIMTSFMFTTTCFLMGVKTLTVARLISLKTGRPICKFRW